MQQKSLNSAMITLGYDHRSWVPGSWVSQEGNKTHDRPLSGDQGQDMRKLKEAPLGEDQIGHEEKVLH